MENASDCDKIKNKNKAKKKTCKQQHLNQLRFTGSIGKSSQTINGGRNRRNALTKHTSMRNINDRAINGDYVKSN